MTESELIMRKHQYYCPTRKTVVKYGDMGRNCKCVIHERYSVMDKLTRLKEEFPEVYASRSPQNWNTHSVAAALRLHTAPQTGDWPEWHVNYNKENEKLPPIPKKTALERFIQNKIKEHIGYPPSDED